MKSLHFPLYQWTIDFIYFHVLPFSDSKLWPRILECQRLDGGHGAGLIINRGRRGTLSLWRVEIWKTDCLKLLKCVTATNRAKMEEQARRKGSTRVVFNRAHHRTHRCETFWEQKTQMCVSYWKSSGAFTSSHFLPTGQHPWQDCVKTKIESPFFIS